MAKLSGPRMRDGRYYSKGKPRGRKPKSKAVVKTKKVYNKTDIRKIAKNVLFKQAESKYFNVVPLSDLQGTSGAGMEPVIARTAYPQMRVLGFATGTGARTGQTTLTYGLNTNVVALKHGRIFAAGDSNNYDIEGSYVTPSLNITTFNLVRTYMDTTAGDDQAIECVPYYIRVLRIKPRPIKGSTQDMNPKVDAFLDQYSQEIGVDHGNFGQYELQLLKPNTKKYHVLQDLKFTLKPPVVYNELDVGSGTYQVANNNGTSRQMTFKHNIGKRLFYNDPNDAVNPDDGFENEYILFHIIPLGTANISSISPDSVRIAAKAVGTFKDV